MLIELPFYKQIECLIDKKRNMDLYLKKDMAVFEIQEVDENDIQLKAIELFNNGRNYYCTEYVEYNNELYRPFKSFLSNFNKQFEKKDLNDKTLKFLNQNGIPDSELYTKENCCDLKNLDIFYENLFCRRSKDRGLMELNDDHEIRYIASDNRHFIINFLNDIISNMICINDVFYHKTKGPMLNINYNMVTDPVLEGYFSLFSLKYDKNENQKDKCVDILSTVYSNELPSMFDVFQGKYHNNHIKNIFNENTTTVPYAFLPLLLRNEVRHNNEIFILDSEFIYDINEEVKGKYIFDFIFNMKNVLSESYLKTLVLTDKDTTDFIENMATKYDFGLELNILYKTVCENKYKIDDVVNFYNFIYDNYDKFSKKKNKINIDNSIKNFKSDYAVFSYAIEYKIYFDNILKNIDKVSKNYLGKNIYENREMITSDLTFKI